MSTDSAYPRHSFPQNWSALDLADAVPLRLSDRIALGLIEFNAAPVAANNPFIVAAPRGDNSEVLAWKFRARRQLVLNRAEFVERSLQFDRKQMIDDAVDGVECQAAGCQVHLTARGHYVRFVAGVHHQRFTVQMDDGLEQ